jgi:hypothetical protein
MAQLANPRLLVASLVLATAALSCVHPRPAPAPVVVRPAPLPPPPPPPPLKKPRVVVLPLDKLALPGTAEELNAKLARVRLPDAEEPALATVSMETAQLQSECAEPTETCYLKIARLVDADRLLWVAVEEKTVASTSKGKKKKKTTKPETRIQVILFDRDKLSVTGHSDETFSGPITGENLDKVIAAAVGVQPAAAPALTPPAAVFYPQPTPAAQQPAAYPQPRPAAQQPAAYPSPAVYPQPVAAPAQPAPAAAPPAAHSALATPPPTQPQVYSQQPTQQPAQPPVYQQQPAQQPVQRQAYPQQSQPVAAPTAQPPATYQQPAPPEGYPPPVAEPPAATPPSASSPTRWQ